MIQTNHSNSNGFLKPTLGRLIKRSNKKYNIDIESLLFLPGNVSVYWKNLDGIFEGGNDKLAQTIDLQSRQDIVGLTDYDYHHLPAETDFCLRQDSDVIKSGQPKHFLDVLTTTKHQINLSTFKMPLKNQNGKIIGVFGISYHLREYDLKKALPMIAEANILIKDFQLGHIHKKPNNFGLTTQQLKCLYWLVKGMTIKQIAKAMTLSPRTIESYLITVKTKLNCNSRTDLIQQALKIPAIKNHL